MYEFFNCMSRWPVYANGFTNKVCCNRELSICCVYFSLRRLAYRLHSFTSHQWVYFGSCHHYRNGTGESKYMVCVVCTHSFGVVTIETDGVRSVDLEVSWWLLPTNTKLYFIIRLHPYNYFFLTSGLLNSVESHVMCWFPIPVLSIIRLPYAISDGFHWYLTNKPYIVQ